MRWPKHHVKVQCNDGLKQRHCLRLYILFLKQKIIFIALFFSQRGKMTSHMFPTLPAQYNISLFLMGMNIKKPKYCLNKP